MNTGGGGGGGGGGDGETTQGAASRAPLPSPPRHASRIDGGAPFSPPSNGSGNGNGNGSHNSDGTTALAAAQEPQLDPAVAELRQRQAHMRRRVTAIGEELALRARRKEVADAARRRMRAEEEAAARQRQREQRRRRLTATVTAAAAIDPNNSTTQSQSQSHAAAGGREDGIDGGSDGDGGGVTAVGGSNTGGVDGSDTGAWSSTTTRTGRSTHRRSQGARTRSLARGKSDATLLFQGRASKAAGDGSHGGGGVDDSGGAVDGGRRSRRRSTSARSLSPSSMARRLSGFMSVQPRATAALSTFMHGAKSALRRASTVALAASTLRVGVGAGGSSDDGGSAAEGCVPAAAAAADGVGRGRGTGDGTGHEEPSRAVAFLQASLRAAPQWTVQAVPDAMQQSRPRGGGDGGVGEAAGVSGDGGDGGEDGCHESGDRRNSHSHAQLTRALFERLAAARRFGAAFAMRDELRQWLRAERTMAAATAAAATAAAATAAATTTTTTTAAPSAAVSAGNGDSVQRIELLTSLMEFECLGGLLGGRCGRGCGGNDIPDRWTEQQLRQFLSTDLAASADVDRVVAVCMLRGFHDTLLEWMVRMCIRVRTSFERIRGRVLTFEWCCEPPLCTVRVSSGGW